MHNRLNKLAELYFFLNLQVNPQPSASPRAVKSLWVKGRDLATTW